LAEATLLLGVLVFSLLLAQLLSQLGKLGSSLAALLLPLHKPMPSTLAPPTQPQPLAVQPQTPLQLAHQLDLILVRERPLQRANAAEPMHDVDAETITILLLGISNFTRIFWS
jgi:hypothetical protein